MSNRPERLRAARAARREQRRQVQLQQARAAQRVAERQMRMVKGKYDLAETTGNNRRHWSFADNLSAAQANSKQVRSVLRNRARYERANNSYIDGMTGTYAADCIGIGPRLELIGDGMRLEDRQIVERRFLEWFKAAGIADKLRVAREARMTDGETFGILFDNPRISELTAYQTPSGKLAPGPSLDLVIIEADQCTNPAGGSGQLSEVDGILFDERRNPTGYRFLRQTESGAGTETDLFPWQVVIHDFTAKRPGQVRGIPEFVASLSLGANMRDFTMSTVDAGKAAAYFTGVLQSQSPPTDPEEEDAPEGFEEIELERNMLTTLPKGWQIGQVKAEHPTTTYPQFKREIVSETARCVGMPYNIAAGDSSGYNFTSGRLDHQGYDRLLEVDREHLERVWLERLLAAWRAQAVLLPDYLPDPFTAPTADWAHDWQWTQRGNIDEKKQAEAEDIQLRNMSKNLRDIYRKRGQDYQVQVRQRIAELKEIRDGLIAAGFEEVTYDHVLAMHQAQPSNEVPEE